MAQSREKLIQRLDELGEEWYAIDRETSPAEKKTRFSEIIEIVFKLWVPESFDGNKTVNAFDPNSIDKKEKILIDLLGEVDRGFDPSKGSLSGFISFRLNRRKNGKGKMMDRNTVPASSLTNHDGSEMDLETYLALSEKDVDYFQPIQPQLNAEAVEKLQLALEIMEQTFLLQEPTKKISESKKRIYQLFFSSRLIDIAKMQVIRDGLRHEREFVSHANQKFFVFCYDSDRQIYVSLDELEDTPLKPNRVVYQLAEQHGRHFKLKDNLADQPIRIPIPKNICIMYLVCEEGVTISAEGVSDFWKKFKKEIEAIRKR